METATALRADPTVGKVQSMLSTLNAAYGPRDFAVRYWDGTTVPAETDAPPRFTLALNHPGAFRAMFWPFNNKGFGEAYIYGDYEVEGDIHAFFEWVNYLLVKHWPGGPKLGWLWALVNLPGEKRSRAGGPKGAVLSGVKRSHERDAEAIGFAYDLSNRFYELFLDKNMLYSCAYFHAPDEHIDTAQERKLDLICRKLRLQPGERLLDIGCGWGGLAVRAAKHYGARVVAVTLSREQAGYAAERAKAAGVSDRVEIRHCDYRDIPPSGDFDKACSIGLAEHIGERMMPVLLARAYGALKPRGHYLHHGITLKANTPYPRWTAFARRYVFPDGEVRPVLTALRAGEKVGFEIRDVESLREHYIRTLEAWVRRLEERKDEAIAMTDAVTYRIFRIYLAGAARGYRNGVYNLYQTLFVKTDPGGVTGLPLTREAWYTW